MTVHSLPGQSGIPAIFNKRPRRVELPRRYQVTKFCQTGTANAETLLENGNENRYREKIDQTCIRSLEPPFKRVRVILQLLSDWYRGSILRVFAE